MIFMLHGNPEHATHAWREIGHFRGEKNPTFYCSWSNLTPWTDQIKKMLITCSTIPAWPSNISNMLVTDNPLCFGAAAVIFQFQVNFFLLSFGISTATHDAFLEGFYIRWLLISRCARMMKTRHFSEKTQFDKSFDITKCLQQIEMLDLLHVCA